jgi:hypothetical protein
VRALRTASAGTGYNHEFEHDGDTTSVTLAVLMAAGERVGTDPIRRFLRRGRCTTYPLELLPSLSAAAHAIHALVLAGEDVGGPARALAVEQEPSGRFPRDKWHVSWLYSTSQAIVALARSGEEAAATGGLDALLWGQRDDGGWGTATSTAPETGLAVLSLVAAAPGGRAAAEVRRALDRAHAWLAAWHAAPRGDEPALWIAKELYLPPRIERAFALAALIASGRAEARS